MSRVSAHRRPLLGLVYLVVAGLLVALSIGIYEKALPWQHTATVRLTTDQVGLGLATRSDVKFQGLLVGEVRTVRTTGTGATVELAIDPDKLHDIPVDVDAMIVPKTLFGDKYVDLRRPPGPDATLSPAVGPRLADGAHIVQTRTSVEVGEIFDRLVPVLRTLQPARVSAVLGDLAETLDGRGAEIAATMRDTQRLLHRLAPSYDTLGTDLHLLAQAGNAYADAAPDLVGMLGDAAGISTEALTGHEPDIAHLLDAATGTADELSSTLRRNQQRLVQLSGRTRPVLQVLSYYSREVPCVLEALDYGNRLANLASGVRGPYIALSVDMIVDQPAYEYPRDLPSNPHSDAHNHNLPAEVPGWAPHCPQLPDRVYALGKTPPPYSQQPYGQTYRSGGRGSAASQRPARRAPGVHVDPQLAMADALAAQRLGVTPDHLPGYAGLLLLPLLADGAVNVP